MFREMQYRSWCAEFQGMGWLGSLLYISGSGNEDMIGILEECCLLKNKAPEER